MKPAVRILAAIASITFLSFSITAQSVDRKLLPNFQKVHNYLYRGAQPKEGGILQLRTLGVKTVIDMCNGSEDSATKAAGLRARG